jgi:hypothetical protein
MNAPYLFESYRKAGMNFGRRSITDAMRKAVNGGVTVLITHLGSNDKTKTQELKSEQDIEAFVKLYADIVLEQNADYLQPGSSSESETALSVDAIDMPLLEEICNKAGKQLLNKGTIFQATPSSPAVVDAAILGSRDEIADIIQAFTIEKRKKIKR